MNDTQMNEIEKFMESGLLEAYAMGQVTKEEAHAVEEMIYTHKEIREELNEISLAIEAYAFANASKPPATVKPFLRAALDYTDRLERGEVANIPPHLNPLSKIEDYNEWLNRPDIKCPADFEDVYAKIIGHTKDALTAVVWIRETAPYEIHDNEYEKFLIVEGACDIQIAEDVYHLKAGDFLSIPLFKNHMVKVTSVIPCKVILQRMAA